VVERAGPGGAARVLVLEVIEVIDFCHANNSFNLLLSIKKYARAREKASGSSSGIKNFENFENRPG
jgi:hypothetical protein